MKQSLKSNCGIASLENLIRLRRMGSEVGEMEISIKSLVSLSGDFGMSMKAYWVSSEDLSVFSNPYIIYIPNDKHFVAIKQYDRVSWLNLPSRLIVITDEKNIRFQELTISQYKNMKGSKGETTIQAAQPAPQPSTGDAVKAWVESMPQVYETEMKYAPLQAQQEVELARKYAGDYGLAMRDAQAAMYPETSRLQESMATQALQGINSEPPQWAKDQYLDNVRANLGTNVGSPIGADYTSRGMLQLGQEWKQYNQNLGLSLAGRQPLSMAQTPQTGQYSQNFTPQDSMGMMANTYGSYVGGQASMFGSQASMANANTAASSARFGSVMGMAGTALGAGIGVASLKSTRVVKRDIVDCHEDALSVVNLLDVKEWRYFNEDKKRIGIILEDSPEQFTEPDGMHMDIVTTLGYLVKSIQQLNKKMED